MIGYLHQVAIGSRTFKLSDVWTWVIENDVESDEFVYHCVLDVDDIDFVFQFKEESRATEFKLRFG